jgi:hypothetical protein
MTLQVPGQPTVCNQNKSNNNHLDGVYNRGGRHRCKSIKLILVRHASPNDRHTQCPHTLGLGCSWKDQYVGGLISDGLGSILNLPIH